MAMRHEKAARVAIVRYLDIVYSCVGDVLIFGVAYEAMTIVGTCLIITTLIVISLLKCSGLIK